MNDKYILDGKVPVPVSDLLTWAKWYEDANRRVDETLLHNDKVRVSTVFLGLDHAWGGGPPMLFETMVFGGPMDQWQERCSTWEQAEALHACAVELAEASQP